MPIIVENGLGLVDAESYASVAEADTYHSNFGNTAWASLTTEAKENALRRATQYIDTAYRFWGEKLSTEQALEFPRRGQDYTLVSRKLVQATSEAALRASTRALFTDTTPNNVKRRTVGPLTTEFFEATTGAQPGMPVVDKLLRDLTSGGSLNVRLERA
ncbi:head-tail connector protein [Microcystis phage Me-ZS1]|nr:head-tail connector protein [Microcystis phage Me-ZS1]